ncbi:MAG: RNA recognition motif domain-containing protein [Candidatus Binatia bacterium]
MKKIYVGNLAWSATESDLREYFATFGEVHSATIVTDRDTGRSRGFGFVEMDDSEADRAISEADGTELSGRPLRVSEAQSRERSGGRGGGGGGKRW